MMKSSVNIRLSICANFWQQSALLLLFLCGPVQSVCSQTTSSPISQFSSIPAPDLSHLQQSCPPKCACSLTSLSLHLKVNCSGPFLLDFPVQSVPRGVQILHVQPCKICEDNVIHLGPDFGQMQLLRVLSIRRGSVPNIGQGALLGLSALRVLDLTENRLGRIIDKDFEGLWTMEELYLDNNNIASIISAGFRHAANLKILSLRCNNLTELAPRIFLKLSRLHFLDLSKNKLKYIDGAIFVDTPNLKTLVCQFCDLKQLKIPDMYALRHLTALDLSHNHFADLDQGLHSNFLRYLKRLQLRHNDIRDKIVIGNKLRNLRFLDLSHNSIEALHFVGRHSHLRHVDLAHNRVQDVHLRFQLERLEVLKLSKNSLTGVVVGVMAKLMPNLTHLHLDQVGLMAWPNTLLMHNSRLQWLNMSGNFIVDVQADVMDGLEELRTLDLSQNFIMGLNQEFIGRLQSNQKLNMIYLQGNPWSCDKCHMSSLLSFLKTSLMYWGTCENAFLVMNNNKNYSDLCLRCTTPEDLENRPIMDLDNDELGECSSSSSPKLIRLEPRRDESNSVWDTNSPLLALAISLALLSLLLLVILVSVGSAYRHYGVYLTREAERRAGRGALDEEQVVVVGRVHHDDLDVVQVLDTSHESYINLKGNQISDQLH